MERHVPRSIHLSLGGIDFRLRSEGYPLFHDTAPPYRQFCSDSGSPPDAGDESVDVLFSIADVRRPPGKPLFDGGSWGVYASGETRSMVFQTRTMADPLYEARFQPGSREVQMLCSRRLLEVEDGMTGIRSYFRYPLDQVLAMYLLGERGLILHAAGLISGARALVFAGISGAGKSTVTRLARAGEAIQPLSDDRIILRTDGESIVAHGTPWPGEAAVAENRHAPASRLLFLEKGDHNAVRAASPRETLSRLLPTGSLPWYDPTYLEAGLRACDTVVRRLPAAVFTFQPDTKVIHVLEEFSVSPNADIDNISQENQ